MGIIPGGVYWCWGTEQGGCEGNIVGPLDESEVMSSSNPL
jgi:hypothetical protein